MIIFNSIFDVLQNINLTYSILFYFIFSPSRLDISSLTKKFIDIIDIHGLSILTLLFINNPKKISRCNCWNYIRLLECIYQGQHKNYHKFYLKSKQNKNHSQAFYKIVRVQYDTKPNQQEETIKCFWIYDQTKKNKSSIWILEIFICFLMVPWLPNRKDWNCKIHYHFIILNFKRNNYNFYKNEKQREGKEIKRIKGNYICKGERRKKKRKKNIIHTKNSRYIH